MDNATQVGKYKRGMSVFGELFDIACQRAGKSWADVAKETKTNRATISKAARGKYTPQRDIVLKWCKALHCDVDMEEAILNSVGHASDRQEAAAEEYLKQLKGR